MKALSVIPGVVKLRVAVILAMAGAFTLLPWGLLGFWPALAGAMQLGLLLMGLYVGWCFWPRLTWGMAVRDWVRLAAAPGQAVHLSFDDGPTFGVTDALLDLLCAQGLRASFFVLVPKARSHPALIRRMVKEGHLIGLHGEDHRAPFFRSQKELEDSLGRARRELEFIAGTPITLYRPSHGWKTWSLLRAVRRAGLQLCFWDYGVWDTDGPPKAVLLQRLRAVTPAGNEQVRRPVVLLHDGRGDEKGVPCHATPLLLALAEWLPTIRDKTSHIEK